MPQSKNKRARLLQFRQFNRNVVKSVVVVRGVLGVLVFLIVLGGVLISWLEQIPVADAVYFSFVTAFTIGYGDISPETVGGRVVSLVVGLTGLIFTGLIVAIASRALGDSMKEIRAKEAELRSKK
tara:strand:- start:518 stop:892 length:375 start_codon:yes stop_codon:yes gene_type:complete